MEKNERIRKTLRGEPADRIPFALWRHIPPEDTSPEGLAASTIRFVQRWDFDMVKAMFPNRIWTVDWGSRFAPYDRGGGFYPIAEYVVKEPSEWETLRKLEPTKGAFAEQLSVIKMMRQDLGPNMPIVATIFSPLTVALELAGPAVHAHARSHPAEVRSGLRVIAETVGDFAQACVEVGADGIFLAVQSARDDALSVSEFEEFGVAYDVPILERVSQYTWFNILHLCKPHMRFETVKYYPVQAVNWHDRGLTGPTLTEARQMFDGLLIAGMDHEGTGIFVRGVPSEARAQAEDALNQTQGHPFMLGPGCVTHLGTPEANIDTVRELVNSWPPV